MICANCGHEVSPGTAFCGNCGAAIPDANPAPSGNEPVVTKEKFKSIAERVWKTLLAVLLNPVEALPTTFKKLSPREALETGLAFSVLFDICALFGLYMRLPAGPASPESAICSKF